MTEHITHIASTQTPDELTIDETPIPGLLVLHLPLHGDNRGWFKENWQRAKMTALGLPDFAPVQNNMSFNAKAGATRGLHAEPWDKLVSVACGKILGAWVDLRAGDSFGRVVTVEMGPETAVYVPRGVGNGYQALADGTTYTYLVNEHWSAAAKSSYTFANLADPQIGIDWPIPLERAELSEADKHHPALADVTPFKPARTVVIGSNGQLGNSLRPLLPDADFPGMDEIDLTRPRPSRTTTGTASRPSSTRPPSPTSTPPRPRRTGPPPGRSTSPRCGTWSRWRGVTG
jgi:dTDP-4-dehydrorhamnose 3,5-epimerase